jgi:Type I phosphodiesterase / nucleotide pyrophosphatase
MTTFRSPTARRVLTVTLITGIVAIPAIVLRALCAGRSCDQPAASTTRVPFCSLPEALRDQLSAGFRDGRSPEVLAVTASGEAVRSGDRSEGGSGGVWPSGDDLVPEPVPLVFWGTGVEPGPIEGSPSLADVAPTVAALIGLDRPHPDVRSGTEIPGVAGADERPRLLLEIILKGVGSDDVSGPTLRSLMEDGASTTEAVPGSLPLDRAAQIATIGTGGFPSEHGITGTLVRNDRGRLVEAWGRAAPFSVIAALGDDLDELNGQRPLIGLVGGDITDRGAIGGNWYVEGDRDDVLLFEYPNQFRDAERLLDRGYGADEVTDLLVVAVSHSIVEDDRGLARLLDAARRAAGGALTVVVAGTGSPTADDPISSTLVENDVETTVGANVVEDDAVGGFFLNQTVLAEAGLSDDDVIQSVLDVRAGGAPLFADAFPGIAVSLARYC